MASIGAAARCCRAGGRRQLRHVQPELDSFICGWWKLHRWSFDVLAKVGAADKEKGIEEEVATKNTKAHRWWPHGFALVGLPLPMACEAEALECWDRFSMSQSCSKATCWSRFRMRRSPTTTCIW
ncbi:hypothetical protein GQ600_16922 [Phytophthora cactorum]|nr:hypothetical protein GQ600_16922 [Phytophthora cactorum]